MGLFRLCPLLKHWPANNAAAAGDPFAAAAGFFDLQFRSSVPANVGTPGSLRGQHAHSLLCAAFGLFVQPVRFRDVLFVWGAVHRPNLSHRPERASTNHDVAHSHGHEQGNCRRAARGIDGDCGILELFRPAGTRLGIRHRRGSCARHGTHRDQCARQCRCRNAGG